LEIENDLEKIASRILQLRLEKNKTQGMTVQELFRNVGFETIVKALQNTHRNDKSIQQTALYKEAFDTLVTLTP